MGASCGRSARSGLSDRRMAPARQGAAAVSSCSSPAVRPQALDVLKAYEVGDVIGAGGYGTVRRGVCRQTGAERAIKTVPKRSDAYVRAVRREVAILAKMDHPNIISFSAAFEDQSFIHLVMQLAHGGDLHTCVEEAKRLREWEAAGVMRQILGAVLCLQEFDVAHRDLKLENCVFSMPGAVCSEGNILKLVDFGSARRCGPDEYMRSMVGTPLYIAPQVLARKYDKTCDLWSAGVVMYILLSGQAPFMGTNLKEICARIRRGHWALSGKAWDDVSAEAKGLIGALMEAKQHSRISAGAALDHAWFQTMADLW
mmetsp:Transcript_67803/g.196073  ORF Transcript_67803/g.196073 Transcript_67803/m.196073 type:complete len:313 (+) Transcript_67803:61-999(+)